MLVEQTIQWLDAAQGRIASFMVTDRIRKTTAALEAIGNHVANVPGRKNLIWVSSGFPLSYGYANNMSSMMLSPERMNSYAEAERTARVLNNARLVIYPIEARGLFDAFSQNPRLNKVRSHYFQGDPTPYPDASVDTSDRDSMVMLAERTGGKAFYNTNDLTGAIRNAVDDSAGSYTLGFTPTHGNWFNQWQKIRVKVRRPGIKLRHRPGYYAMPDVSPSQLNRHDIVLSAASSPLEATALGLTVRARFKDATRSEITLRIDVDPRALQLQRSAGNVFVGTFDVTFAQFGNEGQRLYYLTQAVDLKLQSKTFTAMHREGLLMERSLQLVLGTSEVRVAVRDATTGLTGSVCIPLSKVTPVAE
jgi:hypothetical protein